MIVINARFLTQPITGVQRYAVELCKRLPNKIGDEKVVFVAPKSKLITELNEFIDIQKFGILKGQLWEQINLPFYLRKNGNPLLVNLVGIGPVFYKNKITALYDLAFKHHPRWFSYSFQKIYNNLIPISVNNSKAIITDSYYVKKDIVKTYKINDKKIDVIYAAPSKKFQFYNTKREKFILTVSSIDPRKNLKRIIKAFNLLDIDYELIIVGSKNKTFSNLKLEDSELSKRIIFTGYLEDDELVKLYNQATVFIYASLFEGFGIPPLEAQASGCPCVISNKTALPEVYSDSVEYFDPYSVKEISAKLYEVLLDNDKRDSLQVKGFENCKRYSWENSTKQFIKLIELHK